MLYFTLVDCLNVLTISNYFFSVPPTLVVSPQSKQVHENETFILSCEIAGSPAPSLTWKLDGQTITSDNHRTVTVTTEKDRVTSNLHVDRSGHEDTGMYTCDGKNDAASTSSTSVRVLVYGEFCLSVRLSLCLSLCYCLHGSI